MNINMTKLWIILLKPYIVNKVKVVQMNAHIRYIHSVSYCGLILAHFVCRY